MNRLSYRSKFVLIASLFAIPLALFAGRLALGFHTEATQAKLTKDGLVYLQEATRLITSLEEFRDISVITFAVSNPDFLQQLVDVKKSISKQISSLKNQSRLARHHSFLSSLEYNMTHNKISPGNEASQIQSIFENANVLVEQAYLWRVKLSYEMVSKANTDASVIAILDMINGSYANFISLGEARAFGSYYLQHGYISASGIQLLDNIYQSLTRLINSAEISNTEHQKLLSLHQNARPIKIASLLTDARSLIDEQLIQAISIEGDPLAFYQKMTGIIQSFYNNNDQLLSLAKNLLEQSYRATYRQLVVFYASAALMIALLAYLYIGFFNYVQITIRDLVHSAKRVALGNYEQAIRIKARDELVELAEAMDEMRQSIKVREDELTRIGRTDGLTQLYNRHYFDKALTITLASSSRNKTPVSLVLMDIDHFKSINDQHGHQTGDDCLIQIARLFSTQFQRKTDVVARYGGEEFVAILYGIQLEEALEQTEILRQRIESTPLVSPQLSLPVTASFGVASLSPPAIASETELLSLADTMLYQAKNEGRNRICSALCNGPSVNLKASG